jgi:hypothetical protein
MPGDEVRSVLALVAALSPVDLGDQGLLNAMALFQGVTVLALLSVLKALTDHGVLLERAREVRVSPDVLADEVLTTRAIMLGVDTGFVERVWQAFGTTHAAAVIRNIAELDWLIRSTASGEVATGFPDVFAGIWEDVSREVIAADSAGRSDALSRLAAVAGSQSSRVFSLVKKVLATPTADCHRDWLFGQYEVTHADVQRIAAALLRTCAAASPVLLPEVLDELWLLAQLDLRPPNQGGNHPARIIEDLGSLGNPGSLQRAQVVTSSVLRWLGTPDPVGAPRTPLFALQPLLAKEGMAQEWQPRGLGLSPYLVSVASVTPLREEVRDLLRLVASGGDLRRTVEAIGLLGGALQAPHGYFGQEVPVSAVLEWEHDDLGTIAMLADIAGCTDEPLVRLAIRENVAQHARHALSPAVRASCLALISHLDDHLEDVLTDLLISRDRQSLPPQSKRAAFTADPQAAWPSPPPAAGQSAELEVQLADINPDPLADYEQTYKRRQRERQLVARQLWATNEPVHVIQTLSERLTAIAATTESAARGIGLLLAVIADEYPGRIVALLDTITAADAGPLDSWVAVLLERLRSHDQQEFLHSLARLLQARPGLAAGALRGFMTSRWASAVPEARSLLTNALDHSDREVALQALAGLGELLSTHPAPFSARLTTAALEHPDAVRTALEAASGHQPKAWVPSLRHDDRAAVLAIVAALPKWDWSEETLLAALAVHLPEQVLQVLTDRAKDHLGMLPDRVHGLADAMSAHPGILAGWLRSSAQCQGVSRWSRPQIWPLIAGQTMSSGAVTAITAIAGDGSAQELSFVTGALAQCEGFVLHEPELVSILVGATENLPGNIREEAQADLRSSAILHAYFRSGTGEPAPELVNRRDQARALAQRTDLIVAVQGLYAAVAEQIQNAINDDLRRDIEEDDD